MCPRRYRLRRDDAVSVRVHVPERGADRGRRAGCGYLVSNPHAVCVLRVLNSRLPDSAVGDDRRGVPAPDPGHDRWCGHVRGPLLHIRRAADVPDAAGKCRQTGHVRRVWRLVRGQHVVLLLVLSRDQGQDIAGDRGVIHDQETEEADCRRRRRSSRQPPEPQQQRPRPRRRHQHDHAVSRRRPLQPAETCVSFAPSSLIRFDPDPWRSGLGSALFGRFQPDPISVLPDPVPTRRAILFG